MSVFENVAFGLRVRPRRLRPASAEIDRRVRELLDLVQIPELAQRYPEQISGGQRQRVALARALAIEPQLLLLDEPFGALDALVRKEVRRWVRGLHDRLGLTSILVTHDQEEAMEMADRVAVMERGRVVQFGTPQALLEEPGTAFVARFVGDATCLPGNVWHGRLSIDGFGEFGAVALADGPVEIFVRPHDLHVGRYRDGGLRGQAEQVRPAEHGNWRILIRIGGQLIEGLATEPLERGDACALELLAVTAFDPSGARATLRAGVAADRFR